MRASFRDLSALGMFAVAMVAGCSSAPATRFYVLAPLPASEGPKAVAAGSAPVLGLRPVALPEELDRPEIVTRVGATQLHLAEFDRWAAPLRDNLARVLAEDLALLVPADRVLLFSWSRETPIDYEVTVAVTRFEGTLGGDCSLVADWTVSGRGGREASTAGRSSHGERAGGSYAELVAVHSRLVGALARDIAAALKALPR
jgi:uncharacterized lipoprotein YmbA